MKFKKVLISLMLSLAMVFTMLPAMAFAADEPAASEDSGTNEVSEFLRQLQSSIKLSKVMLNVIGTASEADLRMASYSAVCAAEEEFTKRFGECEELFAELKDKAPDYIAGYKEEIADACALLLIAAEDLDNAIENALPKINNYVRLVKSKALKFKSLKRKSLSFKPFSLKTLKSVPYKGKLTFAAKMLSAKARKYLKFNKTTGKITVKKGAKKGIYKVRLTVKAKKTADYKACTVSNKIITIKVR